MNSQPQPVQWVAAVIDAGNTGGSALGLWDHGALGSCGEGALGRWDDWIMG